MASHPVAMRLRVWQPPCARRQNAYATFARPVARQVACDLEVGAKMQANRPGLHGFVRDAKARTLRVLSRAAPEVAGLMKSYTFRILSPHTSSM